ncbi:hypothetical protein ACE7GA_17000 [Roseomonas sp. CCTCC AB2023176]|uniref:hypothetical protein n=1 Tax=Roseomonas sp. CCTCC AB2023176 TaxID=3342640 RepID=UPI0035D6F84C
MRLADVATGRHDDSIPLPLLVQDRTLVRDVQERLTFAGLLDPGADGFLGPVGGWALARYAARLGEDLNAGITRRTAETLLLADTGGLLPLAAGDDLPGLVVRAMLRRGDFVARHPDCLTIAYVEGMSPDGTPQDPRPDAFSDARLLIAIEDGRPILRGAWQATTAPGRRFVEEPIDARGALRIVPGQHKAWVVGMNAAGRPGEHQALVQVEDIPVTRDADRNFRRDGDPPARGRFDMHQHGGEDAPAEAVGEAGAGCLVGRTMTGHRAFMALVETDARYRASRAYVFLTAILAAEEVLHPDAA